MNTHTTNARSSRLDSALRSLDPADDALTAAQQRHATTTLERILAAPLAADAPAARGAASRRRSRRSLVLISAAAAVTGLAAAAIVELPGDGGAYASWTPEPTGLTAAEVDLVAPVCRDGLSDSSLDMKRAELVLSERRGEVVALLYRTNDPDMAGSCLMHNIPGTDDVEDLDWGAFGGSGPARTAPPRGFIPGGALSGPKVTITDGAVGTDVVAVTIHAPGNLTARATVKNGRYVVWWPGPDYDPAKEGTAEAQPIVIYDLSLADGTTIHNALPSK